MRYMLLLHVDPSGFGRLTPAEQARGLAAYEAFTDDLAKSGALVTSGRLAPATAAKLVRTKGGRPVVTDGPFTETKEQVGGYFLIEADDEAAALAWAARCPASGHGAVEVRPLFGQG